jgi:CBS domain-containing protein
MTIVKDIMKKKVVTVPDNANMQKLCRLLTKNKLSGVPVASSKGKLVGFISERDVIAAIPKTGFMDKLVSDIMTKKAKTIAPDDPLTNASKIFSDTIYRHLPVVKAGKLVGVLSRTDVIKYMMVRYN